MIMNCDDSYEKPSNPIWGFPEMGISKSGWYVRENAVKMDDLRVSPFQETFISSDFVKILGKSHIEFCNPPCSHRKKKHGHQHKILQRFSSLHGNRKGRKGWKGWGPLSVAVRSHGISLALWAEMGVFSWEHQRFIGKFHGKSLNIQGWNRINAGVEMISR